MKQAPAGGIVFSLAVWLQRIDVAADSLSLPTCLVDFAGSGLILNSTMRGSRNG